MPPTPSLAPNRRLRIAFYTLVLLAVMGYIGYSTFTQTGVGGWLMALQFRLFGSASEKLTIMLPLLAAIFVLSLIARRLDPQTMAAMAPAAAPPVGSPAAARQARTMLGLGLVPILLAVPAYLYLKSQAERDQTRPVVPLSLISQPEAPVPADTKYARLDAVFQADYQYLIEQTRYSKVEEKDRYVPLTGPAWRLSQPVRFVLDTGTDVYFDEANQRSISFDDATPFPGTFGGELRTGGLPTAVRQEFERQGLRLAEPYFVLESVYLPGGQAPSANSQSYLVYPAVGVVFGVIMLLGGGLGLLAQRARRQGA